MSSHIDNAFKNVRKTNVQKYYTSSNNYNLNSFKKKEFKITKEEFPSLEKTKQTPVKSDLKEDVKDVKDLNFKTAANQMAQSALPTLVESELFNVPNGCVRYYYENENKNKQIKVIYGIIDSKKENKTETEEEKVLHALVENFENYIQNFNDMYGDNAYQEKYQYYYKDTDTEEEEEDSSIFSNEEEE